MRIIQMELYLLTVAFVGQLLKDVAPEWCRINDIIRALTRVPHRETVVMAGRECDVACP